MRNRLRSFKFFAWSITCLAFTQLFLSATSSAVVYSPPSIYFDGGLNTKLVIPHKGSFDIGKGEFAFGWWQKSGAQTDWPRIFQFGSGVEGSDGFGVSQEEGILYFWLDGRTHGDPCPSEENMYSTNGRCGNRINVPVPVDNETIWHHFAITRKNTIQTKNDVALGIIDDCMFSTTILTFYIDGTKSKEEGFNYCESSLSAPTTNRDLYIGGNGVSGFSWKGSISGFEFYKSLKWSANFEPPTDYSNTDTNRLVLINPSNDFSVNSLKNLADDTNVLVTDATYVPAPTSSPTPSPSDTASPTPSPSDTSSPTPSPSDTSSPTPS
ncbi:MAG: hypothetical protein RL129_1119, partial [Actinomycetota bacterium]